MKHICEQMKLPG